MLLDTVDCVSVIGLWFIIFCKLGGGILTEKTKTCALMPRNCHGHVDNSVIN